ncbi:MAG: threonine synthase [Ardenticatenaceae bacterium]|nr:threonine synthase [Ardenticatenaceae bacterium]
MNQQIYVQCRKCKSSFPYNTYVITCPDCGHGWLDAFYPSPAQSFTSGAAPANLWRYREHLPLHHAENIVSLGEGWTPLLHAKQLGSQIGHAHIYLKDERQNPTGSFKDRQASIAISMMKEAGIREAVVSSVGNVAIAYAAYAARAGIKLWIFVPEGIPDEKVRETAVYGPYIIKIPGTYDQTKQAAANYAKEHNLFLDRGIKGIAAKEAMKTIAYEIAEQLGEPGLWQAPDWYLQSVSGGLGPVGVVKGFQELKEWGLVNKIPQLGCFQVDGCAPMVNAFEQKRPFAEPIRHPHTNIITLTTGDPGEAYEVLFELMTQHGGEMASVSDGEAYQALHTLARTEGISVEPATAVAIAGLIKFINQGIIRPDETVVVNCSGHTMPVSEHILLNHPPRQSETQGSYFEQPEPV